MKPFYVGTATPSVRTSTLLSVRNQPRRRTVSCQVRNIDWPEALLFDCDGVLVDTERDGHRIAFNETFEKEGIPHVWDVETYGRLLEVGGGKERMYKYFSDNEHTEPFKSIKGEAERKDLMKKLHTTKTGIFQELISGGSLPLRPGVKELISAHPTF